MLSVSGNMDLQKYSVHLPIPAAFYEIPFASCCFQYIMGVNIHGIEYLCKFIHKSDIYVALRVFYDFDASATLIDEALWVPLIRTELYIAST